MDMLAARMVGAVTGQRHDREKGENGSVNSAE